MKAGRVGRGVLARVLRALPPSILAFGCVVLVLFFHHGLSANPLSHLLTVFGVVEDHHLRADHWGSQTIDKSVIDGHTYSDKAPLTSFVVIPFYAGWRALNRKAPENVYEDAAGHIADLVIGAVPFAIFALVLRKRAMAKADPGLATRLAFVAAFSTCLVDYSNIYFSHMTAALLGVAAYGLAVDKKRYVLAGFIGGCGVLAEYPIVILNAILAVWLLGRRASTWRRSAAYVAGAVGPAIAMFAYNVAITGKPFDFPYAHVTDNWSTMRTAFGVRAPSLEAAWELLFGQYRGMLFYAPTLAVLGLLALRRPSRTDAPARSRWRLLAIICGAQLLFVSSYFKWDGGWCTGPRHLALVIALLLYEGMPALAGGWPRWRLAFYVTAGFGIFVNIAAAATNLIPSESHVHPLFDEWLPALYDKHINDHNLPVELHLLKNGPWVFALWFGVFALFLSLLAASSRLARKARVSTQ